MVSWRRLVPIGLAAVALGGARMVGAANTERLVAVFPLVVEGPVAPELVETIETALTERAPQGAGLRILRGDELRSRLKKNPRRAVNRCQRRRVAVTCFARLAAKLGVKELLVGRAKATDDGAVVLLLAVGRNRSVVPRGRFEIRTSDIAEEVLTDDRLRSFFGVPKAAPEPAAQAVAVAAANDSNPPPGEEANSDAPAAEHQDSEPDAAKEHGTVSLAAKKSDLLPRSDVALMAALAPAVVAPMPAINRTAVASSPAPTWLTYAGAGLAVVAAAAIGYGTYLGYQSEDIRSSLKRDGTVSQKQAVAKVARSNDLARQANLLLGAGGGGIAVGITIVGLDLLLD